MSLSHLSPQWPCRRQAEGGECHFSGLGLWTEPLPGGGSDWQGCIGSNTPEGETDLFGAVTDELANGTVDLGYSGGMHYGLKVMDYRRDCLPTPPHASADEYEAANMKQVGIYQALSKPMRVALRDTLYEKAKCHCRWRDRPLQCRHRVETLYGRSGGGALSSMSRRTQSGN